VPSRADRSRTCGHRLTSDPAADEDSPRCVVLAFRNDTHLLNLVAGCLHGNRLFHSCREVAEQELRCGKGRDRPIDSLASVRRGDDGGLAYRRRFRNRRRPFASSVHSLSTRPISSESSTRVGLSQWTSWAKRYFAASPVVGRCGRKPSNHSSPTTLGASSTRGPHSHCR
jgi:hypothetical protein